MARSRPHLKALFVEQAAPSEQALLSALTGEVDEELARKAAEGHSPSARSLANASDLVEKLAVYAASSIAAVETGVVDSSGEDPLRTRILETAAKVQRTRAQTGVRPTGKSSEKASAAPSGEAKIPIAPSPAEIIAKKHSGTPLDAQRIAAVDRLGAMGCSGGVADAHDTDVQIGALLDRLVPFQSSGMTFVSAIRGEAMVHRVHRGIPAGLGEVIPRELSFCTHCVSADAPMVIFDTESEPFFRRNLAATVFGARSYLGIPIRVPRSDNPEEKIAIGAFCAIRAYPSFSLPDSNDLDLDEVAFFELFSLHAQSIVSGGSTVSGQPTNDPLFVDGVYRAEFFADVLEVQLRRADVQRERNEERLLASLAVLPASAIARLVPTDLAGRIGDEEIGLLVARSRLEEVQARFPEARFVEAPSFEESLASVEGTGTAEEWIAAARPSR